MCGIIHMLITLKGVTMMKEGIHPQYEKVTVKCACGAEFETRSTKEDALTDSKSVSVWINNGPLFRNCRSAVADFFSVTGSDLLNGGEFV